MGEPALYIFPMWSVGLFFVAMLYGAVELGYRVGLRSQHAWKDADSGGGAVVLSSLFALLGLVLAFTYASGVSRFDTRKQAVVIEANAIGTAFLRADVIDEPGRSELKQALYDYALTRVVSLEEKDNKITLRQILDRTLEQQAKIWPATQRAISQDQPNIIEAPLVSAITEVLDVHTIRLAAVTDRLPTVVMWLLLFVAASALSVAGFNAGLQGQISRLRMGALTLVLAVVMLVILDFDRPRDGMVVVGQDAMKTLIRDMANNLN